MGADPNYPNNAEWISEKTGTYLPPGCEYQDIHSEVNWDHTTEIDCFLAGGTWTPQRDMSIETRVSLMAAFTHLL